MKDQIYQQYLQAYKKGVFNYIKEDINAASGETMPRKYFSGMRPGTTQRHERQRKTTIVPCGGNAV